jgi:hypothetical protein
MGGTELGPVTPAYDADAAGRLPGLDAIGQVEAAAFRFCGDELEYATTLDPTEQRRPASQDERVHD